MTEDKICNLIRNFLKNNAKKICPSKEEQCKCKCNYDIYNEFSLQHELGIYLRDKLDKNEYKVLFEKNVKDICDDNKNSENWEKHEIDILIVKKDEWIPVYAIELKFPTNGQYPEQMKAFLKDIRFMKQVKDICQCKNTYCLTLVNDHNFYKLSNKEQRTSSNYHNYLYFRDNKKTEKYYVNKIYWNTLKKADKKNDAIKYYLIDIKNKESVEYEQGGETQQ